MEVIVIGGGVGGLTAALALSVRGHRVQVIERARRFTRGGPVLRLAPNATAVLAGFGLLGQLLDLGARPRRALLRDLGSGADLAELDLGAPLTARYGTPYVVVGRADLLSLLADACADADVVLRPGLEVTAVEQYPFAASVPDHASGTSTGLDSTGTGSTGTGSTVVTCSGGRVFTADVVVAADGAGSVARALLRDCDPAGEGWAAYRGTVPADALPGIEEADEVIAWTGPDAHFTRYPVRVGEAYEQVAVFRSHLYPLVGAASPGGTGQAPPPGGAHRADAGWDRAGRGNAGPGNAGPGNAGPGNAGRDGSDWGDADRGSAHCDTADWGGPEELDEAFSWAAEPVRAAVRLVRRDQCWRMIDRGPLPTWAVGRVALLGDAVHPMPAYLAQGACQAIEDADVLASALADCPGPHDVPAALARYQARRAPRATRVSRARQVWEFGPLPSRTADDYAASDWLYAPPEAARLRHG